MSSLKQLFDLGGRVALITGGSRGLGLQIAEALGEFGATVVLVARKQQELDATVAELREKDIDAAGFSADMGHPEAAGRLIDRVLEQHKTIDILVNNAGTNWGAPTEEYPLDGWNKVLNLNLTSVFLLCQEVGRRCFLKDGKGAIINISSIEGIRAHHPDLPATIAYNAAKGGAANFTRALAAEWGPRGVRVNAIAPGYFPSKMTDVTLAKYGDRILDQTPRGQLGGPDDLKGVALLLASDASRHITGQVLSVDGGMSVI